jgi:hypothetical protein
MQTRPLVFALAVMAGCSRKAPPAELAPQPSPASQAQGASHGPSTVAVNAIAPGGTLTDPSGAKIALADLLHRHAQTVVVFYRGFY